MIRPAVTSSTTERIGKKAMATRPSHHVPRGIDRRALLARILLSLGVAGAALALLPDRARAILGGCRSDPVLVVNGATVDVFSTLQADPNVIQELDYRVTVPAGSVINQTTLTVGIGFPEKVSYVFSNALPWGAMRIDATVVTTPGTPAFATTVQATSLALSGLLSTASGMSNRTLTVNLKNLPMV